jgi:molybdopterin converting factor small subunit
MMRIIFRLPCHDSPSQSLLPGTVWYNIHMKVKIKLFASLREFGPDEQVVEMPENATIDDAINSLTLPKMALLKIVNGEHRPAKYILKEGDELALFPPIAGG